MSSAELEDEKHNTPLVSKASIPLLKVGKSPADCLHPSCKTAAQLGLGVIHGATSCNPHCRYNETLAGDAMQCSISYFVSRGQH